MTGWQLPIQAAIHADFKTSHVLDPSPTVQSTAFVVSEGNLAMSLRVIAGAAEGSRLETPAAWPVERVAEASVRVNTPNCVFGKNGSAPVLDECEAGLAWIHRWVHAGTSSLKTDTARFKP
ncbi:hypothetical protein EVC45_33535 [Paraburkholderia sp. UYCP14C]|uniref:hypothetical protein n=1 Tax=Paraburkholderia sp. UYCP14C TaxID=2511130 RepID=UPI00101FDA4C|nr:hypothetical protein [Paraburkholderia sp. UYCP14C]RZF25452.1 hypothetical protein EVC45_33535 [Paraburkholderia sp. UYCP14C]